MATAFTRSTRSLQDIDFHKTVINLSLVLVLVGLWSLWFFFASIALYDISAPLAIYQEESVVVNFPFKSQQKVVWGQQAFIRLDGDMGREVGAIPAFVTDAQPFPNEERIEVTLFAPSILTLDLPTWDGLTGWVEIEKERISPATLVVRAVNDKLKRSAIQFTPKNQTR